MIVLMGINLGEYVCVICMCAYVCVTKAKAQTCCGGLFCSSLKFKIENCFKIDNNIKFLMWLVHIVLVSVLHI